MLSQNLTIRLATGGHPDLEQVPRNSKDAETRKTRVKSVVQLLSHVKLGVSVVEPENGGQRCSSFTL